MAFESRPPQRYKWKMVRTRDARELVMKYSANVGAEYSRRSPQLWPQGALNPLDATSAPALAVYQERLREARAECENWENFQPEF